MKCTSGNTGQFLCINRNCDHKNSYVCSDPTDDCKQNHQCCSLISLSYLIKKTRSQIGNDNPQNLSPSRNDLLYPLYDKAKILAGTISTALATDKVVKQINNLLDTDRALQPDDKDKIAKFMNDRKMGSSLADGMINKIEKQLEEFQTLISQFNHNMKQIRSKEINSLKKKLGEQERQKSNIMSLMPVQSRMTQQKVYNRDRSKKVKDQTGRFRETSARKDQQNIDEQKKNKLMNMKINGLSNLQRQKNKEQLKSKQSKPPLFIGPSPVKSRVPQGKSALKFKGLGFEQKISAILKHHVPKGPLYSKITNDIKTINSFFHSKPSNAKLLYRASENQFLANKFHELCDGHRNTLTILITQFDKIIGGFTPLPWKTGSGEWYEDQEQRSFIFNLSSGEKYPLVNREKAIWCSRNFGPSFGHPDLQISDKAMYNANSCANFPMCYNNGNYTNTPGSTQLFCGTKNGHFRIREWEVYQLSFK